MAAHSARQRLITPPPPPQEDGAHTDKRRTQRLCDKSDAALDPIREAIGLYALVEGDDEDVVPRDSYDMDV